MATSKQLFAEASAMSMFNPQYAGQLAQSAGQLAGSEQSLAGMWGIGPMANTPDFLAGTRRLGIPGGGTVAGAEGAKLAFEAEQFRQADARRQQMLELIFGDPAALQGAGGLMGTPLISSVLGNPLATTVGSVTGALSPVLSGGGGGARPGQPGFPDVPGAGGGGLFGGIMQGRGQLGGAIMDLLAGYGGSQRAEIDRQFSNIGNSALARAEDRGLGASSLVPATQLATGRERQRAMGELEDRLTGQRVSALQGIGEGIFGAAENELGRQLQGRGQLLDLFSNLFGSALNVI